MKSFPPPVKESLHWLRKHVKHIPDVALILGSGLGDFANHLERKQTISVADVPCYPQPTVEGHTGRLVFGSLRRSRVLAFQGRVHFYESGNIQNVLHPIYVAYGLGARMLFITNAAGGINRRFVPGDFMIITDHINLTFERSTRDVYCPQFKKLFTTLYDTRIQSLIEHIAAEQEIPIYRGVYCGVKGPSYETAAEIEMIRRLHGDAVGMSTVNEVILARALGMRVGGISCITNLATGITPTPLSHDEVTGVANQVKQRFTTLLRTVIARLDSV